MFLRNPTKKIIEVVSDVSFFQKNIWLKPQTFFIMDSQGKLNVNFIGRFNNLQNDFKILLSYLNIEDPKLTWVNKGLKKNFVPDDFIFKRLREIYKKDYDFISSMGLENAPLINQPD